MDENHQQELNLLDHYDFELPNELIAQNPLPNRSDSRLMLIDRSTRSIDHFHTRDLADLIQANDTLVLNDTRVIPAKLIGTRIDTGGKWQGLFIEADENGIWKLLCKTRGKLKAGDKIAIVDRLGAARFEMTMLARLNEGAWAAKPEIEGTPLTLLTEVGRVPLPHYIRGGNMVDADLEAYQTTYAKKEGAIAAPTAGLHLTESLLEKIKAKGAHITHVTLHVGIGTFRPIKVTHLDQHQMHKERGELTAETADRLNQTRACGGRIIAVGTTCVRVLESAVSSNRTFAAWQGETDLFIHPPYEFKSIDGLMTNFHLPQSSLIVLVRTFGGDQLIKNAYEIAVNDRYRFFSYGDAMMIV